MSVAHKEFLKICSGCGEIFDANIEAEAIHHRQEQHAPLLPRRRAWRPPLLKIARAA